jgi:hypothetical protein
VKLTENTEGKVTKKKQQWEPDVIVLSYLNKTQLEYLICFDRKTWGTQITLN